MNDSGIAFKDVLCDEELVVSARGGRHGVLVLATLGLEETHLLVVGWGENVLLLGVSRELPREDLLLDVSVGADFRNLQGHTLVHHLCIQVLALDFLVLVITSREKLDGVGVREGRKLTLVLRLLQIAPGVLHILIDHSGREILGHGLL